MWPFMFSTLNCTKANDGRYILIAKMFFLRTMNELILSTY
jgi:hypothetical protein